MKPLNIDEVIRLLEATREECILSFWPDGDRGEMTLGGPESEGTVYIDLSTYNAVKHADYSREALRALRQERLQRELDVRLSKFHLQNPSKEEAN